MKRVRDVMFSACIGGHWSRRAFLHALAASGSILASSARANAPLTVPVTGERIALVVGNSAYKDAPLANPGNDARDIGRLLSNAGFEVDLVTDATVSTMTALAQRLDARWRSDKVRSVVFFYAGHGVQLDWRNFLIPVDATLRRPQDVAEQGFDVSQVLRGFASVNPQREKQLVVVLDACRDNPFSAEAKLPSKGLTQFDAPANTLVAFATSPGQVALDGMEGSNSFYTSMLLRELSVPFTPIDDALKRVRTGVVLATLGRQIPWETTSLESDFVLFPAPKTAGGVDDSVEQRVQQELVAWNEAKRSGTIAALTLFSQRFPNGNFSQLAEHRLSFLMEEKRRQELLAKLEESERKQRHGAGGSGSQATEPRESVGAMAATGQAAPIGPVNLPATVVADASVAPSALQVPAKTQVALAAPSMDRPLVREVPKAAEPPTALQTSAEPALVTPPSETVASLPPAQAANDGRQPAADSADRDEPRLTAIDLEWLDAAARLNVPRLSEPTLLALKATPEPSVVLAPTPVFKGSQPLNRRFVKGDRWRYDVIDLLTRRRNSRDLRVTAVDEPRDRVTYNDGQFTSDLMGNATGTDLGALDSPRQFYPATLQVGARWISSFAELRRTGGTQWFRYVLRVAGQEKLTVPAGTFETFRIHGVGFNTYDGTRIERTIWVAPGINANIALEVHARSRTNAILRMDRWELGAYAPST